MNNKIKQFSTGKTDILAVMVPEGAHGFELTKWNYQKQDYLGRFTLLYDSLKMETNLKKGDRPHVQLPEGNWQIVGLSTEVTEGQWRELMLRTKSFLSGVFPVFHYSGFETAKESGLSLIEANECFSVNPLDGVPRYVYGQNNSANTVWYTEKDYQQAQENTGTWLILRKL